MASQFSFKAIGTTWTIDIYDDVSAERCREIEVLVKQRIARFEATYSRFRADSWLTKISKEPGRHALPEDAAPMLSLYQEVYGATEGRVTPLIGQVLVDAGYDKDYSFTQKKELSVPPSWDEVIQYESNAAPPSITIKKPATLDFGAIGKGYAIDIAAKLLEDQGVSAYCVEAGGDMRQRSGGREPIRVGLEDPQDATKVIGVLTLRDKGLAGSSGNRRKWKGFNHIIDPKKLASPEHILALWVVADTAMLADAMATALYFCPAEVLLKRFSFDYLIINPDRSAKGTFLGQPVLELF